MVSFFFLTSMAFFGLNMPSATSLNLSNPILTFAAGPARLAAPALALFGISAFESSKPVMAQPVAPHPIPVQPDLPAIPPPPQAPQLPTPKK